jgi:hypothetical protein
MVNQNGGNVQLRCLATIRVGRGCVAQAWIDPVKAIAYVLMVLRANFPNSDATDVRREFQKAAATALAKAR